MKFQGIIEGSSVGKSHGFAARGSASFQDVFNGVDYVPGKSISALNPVNFAFIFSKCSNPSLPVCFWCSN
jgi:hypothetical protein